MNYKTHRVTFGYIYINVLFIFPICDTVELQGRKFVSKDKDAILYNICVSSKYCIIITYTVSI